MMMSSLTTLRRQPRRQHNNYQPTIVKMNGVVIGVARDITNQIIIHSNNQIIKNQYHGQTLQGVYKHPQTLIKVVIQ